jgi:hypothetical protein
MKDRVDKSMGIVTHIVESLARIKPTESLRLTKREDHKKRKCSDFSGNSPGKILASRCVCKNFFCSFSFICNRIKKGEGQRQKNFTLKL